MELFEPIFGTYSKKHLRVKSRIRKIAALPHYQTYYIGATHDIDARWANYQDWAFKQVLYKTSSYKVAKKVEEDLIRYCQSKKDKGMFLCNQDPYSRGLKDKKGHYYIYLLADKVCQPRH